VAAAVVWLKSGRTGCVLEPTPEPVEVAAGVAAVVVAAVVVAD